MPRHVFILVLLSALLTAAIAQAHRATLFAWVEGDRVLAEARFSGKRPAIGSDIAVIDAASNNILLTAKTDGQGKASFALPDGIDSQGLRLELDAGPGHAARWVLTAKELGLTWAEPQPEATSPSPSSLPATATVDPQKLEKTVRRVVDTALDEKLAPITRLLAEQAHAGPSLTEILGGLGWLAGLVGVAAYVQSRRTQPKQ